jgi:hypothetical protein
MLTLPRQLSRGSAAGTGAGLAGRTSRILGTSVAASGFPDAGTVVMTSTARSADVGYGNGRPCHRLLWWVGRVQAGASAGVG